MHPTPTPRDRRAVHIPGPAGTARTTQPRSAIVIGGGIAGLAAASGLSEKGVTVTLIEPHAQLGGRVRAWQTHNAAGEVTMSRGFHAFFRQYYNLRTLLSRAGNLDYMLRPVEDYPVISGQGDADSFRNIPRQPPWNFISFVLKSPTFRMRDLAHVDLDMALSLLDVNFPHTYTELDGISAAEFLDRLHFPDRARHLALEVFARSFFADPREFSAAELVAMFHSYFLGSSEGLLFDVPRDDFDTSLWHPLGAALARDGVRRVHGNAHTITHEEAAQQWCVGTEDGGAHTADAVVLAAGPDASRELATRAFLSHPDPTVAAWAHRMSQVTIAPPFAVQRIWFDRPVHPNRAAFLGTAGFGALDNVSVLERFEQGARTWATRHGGSVIELHAYAVSPEHHDSPELQQQLATHLREELARVYPETRSIGIIAEEFLVERDCALMSLDSWGGRPDVRTPLPGLVLAGDWIRSELPIALMERAATTGWMASNELLRRWGVAGQDLWSVPTRSRHWWAPKLRRLLAKRSRRQT